MYGNDAILWFSRKFLNENFYVKNIRHFYKTNVPM